MPELPPVLRYEFFFQLLSDIPDADSLDWSQAQTGPLENTRIGPLTNLSSLRAKAGSETCFTGTSVYFYDDPSRQLFFWWQEKGIPGRVWDQLDVVARKKLKQQFPRDPGLAKLA
jgi:ATP-dependent phosphoenolpyruvate carboxykinase